MESGVLLGFSGVAASVLTLILGLYFTEPDIGRKKVIFLSFIAGCGILYWLATISLLINYHFDCDLLLEISWWLISFASLGLIISFTLICVSYPISYKRTYTPKEVVSRLRPSVEKTEDSPDSANKNEQETVL